MIFNNEKPTSFVLINNQKYRVIEDYDKYVGTRLAINVLPDNLLFSLSAASALSGQRVIINWDDGTKSDVSLSSETVICHEYPVEGEYIITITDTISALGVGSVISTELSVLNTSTLLSAQLSPKITKLYPGCFNFATSLSTIDISTLKLSSIDSETFQHCEQLSSIKFSPETLSGLVELSSKAFNDCANLLEFPIFENLSVYPSEVFAKSGAITPENSGTFVDINLNIPEKCQTIDSMAFAGIPRLNEVSIANETTLCGGAFVDINSSYVKTLSDDTQFSAPYINGLRKITFLNSELSDLSNTLKTTILSTFPISSYSLELYKNSCSGKYVLDELKRIIKPTISVEFVKNGESTKYEIIKKLTNSEDTSKLCAYLSYNELSSAFDALFGQDSSNGVFVSALAILVSSNNTTYDFVSLSNNISDAIQEQLDITELVSCYAKYDSKWDIGNSEEVSSGKIYTWKALHNNLNIKNTIIKYLEPRTNTIKTITTQINDDCSEETLTNILTSVSPTLKLSDIVDISFGKYTLSAITENALTSATHLSNIYFPSTIYKLGSNACFGLENLKIIRFEHSLGTKLDNNVFANCTALTSLRSQYNTLEKNNDKWTIISKYDLSDFQDGMFSNASSLTTNLYFKDLLKFSCSSDNQLLNGSGISKAYFEKVESWQLSNDNLSSNHTFANMPNLVYLGLPEINSLKGINANVFENDEFNKTLSLDFRDRTKTTIPELSEQFFSENMNFKAYVPYTIVDETSSVHKTYGAWCTTNVWNKFAGTFSCLEDENITLVNLSSDLFQDIAYENTIFTLHNENNIWYTDDGTVFMEKYGQLSGNTAGFKILTFNYKRGNIIPGIQTGKSKLIYDDGTFELADLSGIVTRDDIKNYVQDKTLVAVEFNYDVVELNVGALSGYTDLKSVKFNNISSLNVGAFKNCTSLSNISFINSLKFIGNEVFENCTSLKTIKINSGISQFGNKTGKGNAFYNSGLSAIDLTNCTTIPTLNNINFFNGVDIIVDNDVYGSFCTAQMWNRLLPIIYATNVSNTYILRPTAKLYNKFFKSPNNIVLIKENNRWYLDGELFNEDSYGIIGSDIDLVSVEYLVFGYTPTKILPKYPDYLTFTAEEDGVEIKLQRIGTNSNLNNAVLEYTIDNDTWNTYSLDQIISLNQNEFVKFRAATEEGNTTLGINESNYHRFTLSNNVCASGNIMSLLNKTMIVDISNNRYCFYGLFSGCGKLKNAPFFPATEIGDYGYKLTFNGCSRLEKAPMLLLHQVLVESYRETFTNCRNLSAANFVIPKTVDYNGCRQMFSGVSALIKTPKIVSTNVGANAFTNTFASCYMLTGVSDLPATTLASGCYSGMFRYCTSLKTAPKLPAKNLADSCYSNMFNGCSALSIAPELLATVLSPKCYVQMFENCTNLSDGPILSATELVAQCYDNMFNGCSKLSSMNVGFIKWNQDDARTHNWLNGVSDLGYFTSDAALPTYRGPSNIPINWKKITPTFKTIAEFEDGNLSSYEVYGTLDSEVFNSTTNKIVGLSVGSSVSSIAENCFSNPAIFDQLQSFEFRDGTNIYSIGASAFMLENSELQMPLQHIDIKSQESTLTSIGERAFCNTNIQELIIPNKAQTLGNNLVEHCVELTNLTLPSSLTSLPEYIAKDCISLKSMTFPSKLSVISKGAFYNTGLISLVLWKQAKGVNRYAWEQNDPSISNYNYVVDIGEEAFMNCSNLLCAVLASWYEDPNIPSAARKYIPIGLSSIQKSAFKNCDKLSYIFVNNPLSVLGEEAFMNCSQLTANIIAPEIKPSTFENCTSLKTISFGGVIPGASIQENAYKNSGLSSVSFSTSLSVVNTGTSLNGISVGLESIGPRAFSDCQDLLSVNYINFYGQAATRFDNTCLQNSPSKVYVNNAFTYDIMKSYPEWSSSELSDKLCVDINQLKNTFTIVKHESTDSLIIGMVPMTSSNMVLKQSMLYSITSYPEPYRQAKLILSVDVGTQVKRIAYSTFYKCINLQQIRLPETDGVAQIDYKAFDECTSLHEITLPSTVINIGDSLFNNCTSLSSVYLPNTLTACGKNLFTGATNLQRISIPNILFNSANISCIEQLTTLTDIKLFDGISTIYENLFQDLPNLTSINIPSSVNEIKSGVLLSCNDDLYDSYHGLKLVDNWVITYNTNELDTTNMILDNTIHGIAENALCGCSTLTGITIPQHIKLSENCLFGCNNLSDITFINRTKADVINVLYYYKVGINSDGTAHQTTIHCVDSTFDIYSPGTKFTFDNTSVLTTLYSTEKFDNASLLSTGIISEINRPTESHYQWTLPIKNIELGPEIIDFNTISINLSNYQNYNNILKLNSWIPAEYEVTLANSGLQQIKSESYRLSSIDSGAFISCNTLQEADFQRSTISSVNSSTFENCQNLETVKFSSSLLDIKYKAFKDCINLKNIIFEPESNVSSISGCAFENCSSLTSIILSDVTKLGPSAFNNCVNLKYIDIRSVQSRSELSNLQFNNCNNITSAYINNDLIPYFTIMGYNRTGITDLSINTSAGVSGGITQQLSNCVNLSSVYLADNIVAIKKESFINCLNLQNINLENIIQCGDSAFENCSSLQNINIPNISSIGWRAFANTGINTLVLPGKLSANKSIDTGAFYNCYSLTSITMEDGIKTLSGYSLFANCSNLVEVNLPNTLSLIYPVNIGSLSGSESFAGCSAIKKITISKYMCEKYPLSSVFRAAYTHIEDVVVGSDASAIISNMFNGCESLVNIDLPSSISSPENVGENSFYNCNNLTELEFSGMTVEQVSSYADIWGIGIIDTRRQEVTCTCSDGIIVINGV